MAGPGGREIARLVARVAPDTSNFAQSLQRYLDRVEQRAQVQVRAVPDTSRFARELQARLARTRARVQVPVTPDLSDFQERLRAGLRRPVFARVKVPVQLELRADAIARLRAEVAGIRPNIAVPVHIDVDTRPVERLQRTLAQAGDGGGRSGLGGVLAGLVRPLASLPALASSAVPSIASLGASLAQMAPAAAVGATALLSVVTAQTALKLGMQGVGDALKVAFDPAKAEEFAKAMDKLAPSARRFVKAVQSIKPQFDKLQLRVQSTLFEGLGKALEKTARDTGPVFAASLTEAASALNRMGREVLTTASRLGRSGALGQALDSASEGLHNLANLPSTIVQGIVQIAAAAGPSFERLTKAGGSALDRLSQRLTDSFESGALQDVIEQAIDTVGQFLKVLGNVGKILGNIFKPAAEAGGGFLGILEQVTGELAKVTRTKGVQDALKALFETMALLGKTVAPLLGQALAALGPVLVALAPPVQLLIRSLGAALQPVIKALGPVLVLAARAVGALVTAIAPLLPVVGNLVATLLPALSPLLTTVADVFRQIAPAVEQVAKAIGPTLAPVIEGLAEVLTQLVQQSATQFLGILRQLMPLVPQVTPVLIQLGKSLGEILTALAPLIPQLTTLGIQLIAQVLPAVLPLIPPLLQLATIFLRLSTKVITGAVIPALGLLIKFLAGMRKAFQPAIDAATWLTETIAGAFQWLYDVLVGHSIVPDLVRDVVAWFAGLPGKAAKALAKLGSSIVGKVKDAGADMISTIRTKIGDAADEVGKLPGKAKSALGKLGGTLASAGRQLIGGFISGITDRFGDVQATLSKLTGMLPDWKGPARVDVRILEPAGELLMKGFMRGIDTGSKDLRRMLETLTASLPSEFLMSTPNTPVLQRSMVSATVGAATLGDLNVKVFVGDREITDIARAEVSRNNQEIVQVARAGRKRG